MTGSGGPLDRAHQGQQVVRRQPRPHRHRPDRRPGRGRRGDRAVGLGQVDAVPDDQPARADRLGHDPRRRRGAPRGGPGPRPAAGPTSAWSSSSSTCSPTSRVLDNVTLGPIKVRRLAKADAGQRAHGPARAGRHRRQGRQATRPSCPAASSSGPRSPARWPCSPRSCCSTSRPRRSTPR